MGSYVGPALTSSTLTSHSTGNLFWGDNDFDQPKLTEFSALTLDGYATLIDRNSGIVDALQPWLQRAGVIAGRNEILRAFAEAERQEFLVDSQRAVYVELLLKVHKTIADFFGIPSHPSEAANFAASIHDWPLYPDAKAAIAYLKHHFRLFVLTNTDQGSFATSKAKFDQAFDDVYTADRIGSYKPNVQNFAYMLDRLEEKQIAREKVLHISASVRFDLHPAEQLDLRTCWIQRDPSTRTVEPGLAFDADDARPVFCFKGLDELADAHRAERKVKCGVVVR